MNFYNLYKVDILINKLNINKGPKAESKYLV